MSHPRYPIWALVCLSVATFVATATAATTDAPLGALAFDFVLALVVTFAWWYGIVVFFGWAWRCAQRHRDTPPPAK